jgi:hypothetical protein
VHADIGGGYIENESRLSDLTLGWMLAAASLVPNGLKFDPSVLNGYPDASGPQHDECKVESPQRSCLNRLPSRATSYLAPAASTIITATPLARASRQRRRLTLFSTLTMCRDPLLAAKTP